MWVILFAEYVYVKWEFWGHLPTPNHSAPRQPLSTVQLEQILEVPSSFNISVSQSCSDKFMIANFHITKT